MMSQDSQIEVNPNRENYAVTIADIYSRLRTDGLLIVTLLSLIALKSIGQVVTNFLEQRISLPASYNREVLGLMNQLLEAAECDRVELALFKNGDRYLNGWCHIKMQITHEVVRPQISRISQLLGEVDLSALVHEVELYRKAEYPELYYLSLLDEGMSVDCRSHLRRIGVTAMANHLIVYKEVDMGIISLQYCHETNSGRLKELINKRSVLRLTEQLRSLVRNERSDGIKKIVAQLTRGLQ